MGFNCSVLLWYVVEAGCVLVDDASARIREISALLKGISILYQSSYATDFIFVSTPLSSSLVIYP